MDILLMQSSFSSPGEWTFLPTYRTGSWITRLLSSSLKNRHWTMPTARLNSSLTSAAENITYQKLLRHLSVAFQGGDNKANLLAEFYSHGQKLKESEEALADELQILACKVIFKRPDFRNNFRYDTETALCQPVVGLQ